MLISNMLRGIEKKLSLRYLGGKLSDQLTAVRSSFLPDIGACKTSSHTSRRYHTLKPDIWNVYCKCQPFYQDEQAIVFLDLNAKSYISSDSDNEDNYFRKCAFGSKKVASDFFAYLSSRSFNPLSLSPIFSRM